MIDPEGVTSPWLTEVLEACGVASGVTVDGVDARPIGTGQVGTNIRFTLRWSETRPDLPGSVVGKFPATNEASLAAAAATSTYVREVGFYRDIQRQVPVRTPTVHYLDEDRGANSFVILMEDLASATVGDQLAGCGVREAELAVDAAADLHAATWGHGEELAQFDWIDTPTPEDRARTKGLYDQLFEGFADRYRPALTTDELDAGRWIGVNFEAITQAAAALNPCLVHGDFRLDNMLFGDGITAPRLTVVDWQTARLGAGPADVAYFLGAGLLPEVRRAEERDLVDRYHAALRNRGVDAAGDDLWRAHRLGSTSGYVMAVIASQIVGRTERGDDMFVTMARRHADQMLGVDAFAVIE